MALDTLARAMAARADSKAKTAYQYAVEGGYTGTEEQFTEDMGKLGINAEAVDNAVRFDIAQAKTELQKLQAQANIGLDTTDGDINAQLAVRALINGYYSSMGVGLADNLNANEKIPLTKPYVIRTTADSEDVAGLYKRTHLTGGSLVWNQMFNKANFPATTTVNGITFTNNGDGSISLSGEATAIATLQLPYLYYTPNHVYAYFGMPSGDNATEWFVRIYTGGSGGSGYIQTSASGVGIFKAGNDYTGGVVNIYARQGFNADTKPVTIKLQMVDLTTTFGTTFANAIYSMADHGIAWLYATFPELNGGNIPYSAPHFEHSKYKGVTSTNENLSSVGFTVGKLWSSGVLINAGTQQAAITEKVKCLPNTSIAVSIPNVNVSNVTVYCAFFDVNGNWISSTSTWVQTNKTYVFTTLSNCYFVAFSLYRNGSAFSQSEVTEAMAFIHYDTSYDGIYIAPTSWHTDLGSDVLKGIPVADDYTGSNVWSGKWHWEGDEKAPDGTITRAYGELASMKTLSWSYITNDGEPYFRADVSEMKKGSPFCMHSPRYTTATVAGTLTLGDKMIVGSANATVARVFIRDTTYTDATLFANSLDGVPLLYELNTPTTESGTAYEENEQCHNWGIQYVEDAEYDDGNRAFKMPMGGEEVYTPNLTEKVEAMPSAPVNNGDFIVRVANNKAEYIPLPNSFPTAPSADGTYSLKCTVSSGTATLSWVADT